MNPIHESGFASLVVLFFAAFPPALAALVALGLLWKQPKAAMNAANVTMILAGLVCVLAAVTTHKLHAQVDYWIDTGGYGPPAQIRAQYGATWHDSAQLTAWAGLVFSTLPLVISAVVHAVAKRKEKDLPLPVFVLALTGIAVLSCLLMAIL